MTSSSHLKTQAMTEERKVPECFGQMRQPEKKRRVWLIFHVQGNCDKCPLIHECLIHDCVATFRFYIARRG